MSIARLAPEDVGRLRAIRRRALLDSPDVFATTLEQNDAETDDLWRERLASPRSATFVALQTDHDVGLVMGAPFIRPGDEQGDACGLFGMWVAPEARRLGLAALLVSGLIDWARSAGYPRMLLDVGVDNTRARGLYERCGFGMTGHRTTLPPPRTNILEDEFLLVL